jgi:NADH-quinone oxidoreductase subunit J
MNPILAIIAAGTLVSAAIAMALRHLIRSVLLFVVSWVGIAIFFLWAGAEFLAFAQVLVYAGAIAMVVLFAILLTGRGALVAVPKSPGRHSAFAAVLTAAAVVAILAAAILRTSFPPWWPVARVATVRDLGIALAGPEAAALLAAGVLLTAALLGAIVIAAGRKDSR